MQGEGPLFTVKFTFGSWCLSFGMSLVWFSGILDSVDFVVWRRGDGMAIEGSRKPVMAMKSTGFVCQILWVLFFVGWWWDE